MEPLNIHISLLSCLCGNYICTWETLVVSQFFRTLRFNSASPCTACAASSSLLCDVIKLRYDLATSNNITKIHFRPICVISMGHLRPESILIYISAFWLCQKMQETIRTGLFKTKWIPLYESKHMFGYIYIYSLRGISIGSNGAWMKTYQHYNLIDSVK